MQSPTFDGGYIKDPWDNMNPSPDPVYNDGGNVRYPSFLPPIKEPVFQGGASMDPAILINSQGTDGGTGITIPSPPADPPDKKKTNLLLIGGLALLAYFLFKGK